MPPPRIAVPRVTNTSSSVQDAAAWMPPPFPSAWASLTVTVRRFKAPPAACAMAPPLPPASHRSTMVFTNMSVPPAFARHPPSAGSAPSAIVRSFAVSDPPGSTVNGRIVLPPERVISPWPSSATVPVIVLGTVSGIVTAPGPQANVIVPPASNAASRAASVQLAADPVPTTASARAQRAGASTRRSTNVEARHRMGRSGSVTPDASYRQRAERGNPLAGAQRMLRTMRGRVARRGPVGIHTTAMTPARDEGGDQLIGSRLSDVRPWYASVAESTWRYPGHP
jgi:hypothetical protein